MKNEWTWDNWEQNFSFAMKNQWRNTTICIEFSNPGSDFGNRWENPTQTKWSCKLLDQKSVLFFWVLSLKEKWNKRNQFLKWEAAGFCVYTYFLRICNWEREMKKKNRGFLERRWGFRVRKMGQEPTQPNQIGLSQVWTDSTWPNPCRVGGQVQFLNCSSFVISGRLIKKRLWI